MTTLADNGRMAHALQHHGLIEVPLPGRPNGVYWLRLYRGEPRCVAVLTEVPGNPSASLTNAVSRISDFVARRFSLSLSELTVFEIWARGSVGDPGVKRVTFTNDGAEKAPGHRDRRDPNRVELAGFTGRPEWWSSTRRVVEAIVGTRLAEMPPHDELLASVRALGGGTTRDVWRRVFEVVDVADLPSPHNPSSCEHSARFEDIEERLRSDGVDDWLAAGRLFLDTLTPDDCARCRYHDADWRAIADESVRIVEGLGVRDQEEYLAAAVRSGLGEDNLGWLKSLFFDPIDVAGGSYTNGQHRGCALRFSGAAKAVVVTGDEFVETVDDDWTYDGGG
ncbi:MAG: hypothetical protein JWO62_2273 [Acidimicrobiaceae bacterium]|nr:hypothetical protein [Acidimicrobiaceae bacterium]